MKSAMWGVAKWVARSSSDAHSSNTRTWVGSEGSCQKP